MQLEVEECSERTAGAIRGNRRAPDRRFGLTGRRQAGGHSGEAVQRLKRSHAGGYRCGEKPGWSTGSRLHTPPAISPGGHPLPPRKGDARLRASKRSRVPQRGRRCGGEHSPQRALNPRAPPIQKGTVGPLPIRSEGRGMRPKCYSGALPSTRKPEEWGISVPTQPLFLGGRTANLQTGSLEEGRRDSRLRDSSYRDAWCKDAAAKGPS